MTPRLRWPRRPLTVVLTVLVLAPATAGVLAASKAMGPTGRNPEKDAFASYQAATRMTPDVAATFQRACGDCHTNRTRWPWYSRVAPVSSFVVGHVNHGRRHLNLSEWDEKGGGERVKEPAEAICREVRAGRMPLGSYLWMHGDARLRAAEVDALCAWAGQAGKSGPATVSSASSSSPSVSRSASGPAWAPASKEPRPGT